MYGVVSAQQICNALSLIQQHNITHSIIILRGVESDITSAVSSNYDAHEVCVLRARPLDLSTYKILMASC